MRDFTRTALASSLHNGRHTATNGNASSAEIVSRKTLLLNQNYEPLTLCTVKRAIVMAFSGKVEIVERHESLAMRTVDRAFQLPTVIRLERYVKSPRRRVLLNRRNLLLRDGHRCQYCGKSGSSAGKSGLTIDHVIPKRAGGGYTWENLVCACVSCNSKKGHRTPEQANMKLRCKPRRPDRITFIRQSAANGAAHDSWRPYLFMD